MLAGGVCRASCHTPLLDKEVSGAGHVLLMMHLEERREEVAAGIYY